MTGVFVGRGAVLGCLGAAVFVVLGCGDSESTGSGGSASDATAGSGGAAEPWIVDECGVCYSARCQGQIAACAADPGCGPYLDCLDACPSEGEEGPPVPACVESCRAGLGDGTSATKAFTSLEYCRQDGDGAAECPTCGFTKTPPQECPASVETNPCFICTDENCCDSYAARIANPEAEAARACQLACPSDEEPGDNLYAPCVADCLAQHPDGVVDWGTYETCALIHCSTPETCNDTGKPIDPCVQCNWDHCGDLDMECAANGDCFRIKACVAACYPELCQDECIAAFPAGEDAFNTLGACAANECIEVCQ